MRIIFSKEDFIVEYNKRQDFKSKLNWVSALSSELENVLRNYSDSEIKKYLRNHKLHENYPGDIYHLSDFNTNRLKESKYKNFLYYLGNDFLPFINYKMHYLKNDLYFDNLRKNIKKGILKEEEKYPIFDFNYDKIEYYADNVFLKLEEKIAYLEYVLLKFYEKYKNTTKFIEIVSNIKISEIDLVKRKVKYLKASILSNSSKPDINVQPNVNLGKDKIVWNGGKTKLLKMFGLLCKEGYLPKYKSYEVLFHFIDDKGSPFIKNTYKPNVEFLVWKKQDYEYSYWINILVENELIPKRNKFVKFNNHFRNSDGNTIKDSSQKLFNKEAFGKNNQNLDKIIQLLNK
ncbi:MAG: hypothetical protein LWX07_07920 [Bacteroidetes bacterium]|nr:hypothetical protein [Bacteroidota bacterium]